MKPKLIFLIGASYSGKTLWAKTFCNSGPNIIRICPEELQLMMRSNSNVAPAAKEALIIGLESLIISFLTRGYTVILDALLNLDMDFFDQMSETFRPYADLQYRLHDVLPLAGLMQKQDRLYSHGQIPIKKSIGEISEEIELVEKVKCAIIVMEQAKYIRKFGVLGELEHEHLGT